VKSLIIVPLLAGGCAVLAGDDGFTCPNDSASVEAVLIEFLSAAKDLDSPRAERTLIPGNRIDEAVFHSLSQRLADVNPDNFGLVDDQYGAGHSFKVVDDQGQFVGQFQVLEESKTCFCVSWGISPSQPSGDGGSPTVGA
jgi:hypothetical protein